MNTQITIVDYRAGNIASVRKAFEYLGTNVNVTTHAPDICRADKIVLPGVGHFTATRTLDDLGLRRPITEAIAAGVPFLGICVGMQWLYEGSTEAPETAGLAAISGLCGKFPTTVKSPHVGWNTLHKTLPSKLLARIPDDPYVYYTHSYRASVTKECIATTEYGGEFAAAVERDNVFGVQFHPEKSGDTGLAILKNFVEL